MLLDSIIAFYLASGDGYKYSIQNYVPIDKVCVHDG